MALLKGVDLSAMQGAAGLTEQCWDALAAADIKFAILRLCIGNETWSDLRTVQANVARAKARGIAVTGYFFPYPLPHLDPREQVERFVSLLAGLGTNVGELPPAFDLEWPPPEHRDPTSGRLIDDWAKWKCSASQIRDWALAALDHGESLTGVTWLLYSYRYYLKRIQAELAPEFAARPLWLADYTYQGIWPTDAQIVKLAAPQPWDAITIVQHDGNGGLRLPNGGDADFNVLIGGDDRLAQLTAGAAQPPPVFSNIPSLAAAQTDAPLVSDDELAAYRRERLDEAA